MESPSNFQEYWDMIKTGLRLAWQQRPHSGSKEGHHVDWSHMEGVDAANAKQELSIGQSDLFGAAYLNDLDLLEKFVGTLNGDMRGLEQIAEVGNTALHLALQRDNQDVALRLMQLHPSLINITYEGRLYNGQHCLHIAIINQNLKMVQELVERGASINTPRAIGSFFHASVGANQFHYGEHPVAFAACTGQADIVEYLVDKGADLYVQDSHKNTILHLLVKLNKPEISGRMYDLVESLADGQAYQHRGMFLEDCLNRDGYTPLKLAAYGGYVEIFRHLINKKKTSHWTYGPVTSAIYNLSQLDSFGEMNSAIDLIVRSQSPRAYELLRIPPFPQLLRQKWSQFGFFYFCLWALVYVMYMTVVTLVLDYRPVSYSPCTESSVVWQPAPAGPNGTGECFPRVKRMFSDNAYIYATDYIRLVGEMVVIGGALLSISLEAPDLWHRGFRNYFSSVGSGIFHFISWCYIMLILSAFTLRLVDSDHEEIPQSLALVLGWTYVLYFARGFQRIGPYIVMIQKMLTGDVFRFLILYIVLDLGFSKGLHNLVADTKPHPPFNFETASRSHFFLFRLAVGIADFNQQDTRVRNETLVVVMVVFYLLLMLITLVNLLIASMAATHEEIRDERVGIWQRQLASIILLIERRLPKVLTIRSGFPGTAIGLTTENWYIRVQEIGELKKISHMSRADKSLHSIKARVTRIRPRLGTNGREFKLRSGTTRSAMSRSVRIAALANDPTLALNYMLPSPPVSTTTYANSLSPLSMSALPRRGSYGNRAFLPQNSDDVDPHDGCDDYDDDDANEDTIDRGTDSDGGAPGNVPGAQLLKKLSADMLTIGQKFREALQRTGGSVSPTISLHTALARSLRHSMDQSGTCDESTHQTSTTSAIELLPNAAGCSRLVDNEFTCASTIDGNLHSLLDCDSKLTMSRASIV